MLSKQGKIGQLKMTKLILRVDKPKDCPNAHFEVWIPCLSVQSTSHFLHSIQIAEALL